MYMMMIGLGAQSRLVFYSVYGRGQNTQPNISYEDNGNEPYVLHSRLIVPFVS